jgi:hypothetical protein
MKPIPVLFLPDIWSAGFPANPGPDIRMDIGKTGYRYDRIPIRPHTGTGYPVPGLTGYPAQKSVIRPDTRYQKDRIIRTDIRYILSYDVRK